MFKITFSLISFPWCNIKLVFQKSLRFSQFKNNALEVLISKAVLLKTSTNYALRKFQRLKDTFFPAFPFVLVTSSALSCGIFSFYVVKFERNFLLSYALPKSEPSERGKEQQQVMKVATFFSSSQQKNLR